MGNQPKTRVSLILRLRHRDDADAWQEFVEIYQPLVFRLAKNKGLQDADALDTTQEVLARVAKAINRWDPDPDKGTFRGWLNRITRNLVVEFMRSKNRLPITSDNSSVDRLIRSIPDDSPEAHLFDLEEQRQVFTWAADKIRDSFQEKSWQAFWMTSVEAHSVEVAAKRLGISKGAVYIARSRVMARLKNKVRQHVQEAGHRQANIEITQPFIQRNEP